MRKVNLIIVSIIFSIIFDTCAQTSTYSISGSSLTICGSGSTGTGTSCGFNYFADNIKLSTTPTMSGTGNTTLNVSINRCTGTTALVGEVYLKMSSSSTVGDIVCGNNISQNLNANSTTLSLSANLSSLFTTGRQYFTVVFKNTSGVRSYSKIFWVTATPPSCNLQTTGGSSSSITSSSFTANWNSVSGASEYQLSYTTFNDNNYNSPLGTYNLTSTSRNITGLNSSTQYRFRVRTKCSNNLYGNWVNIATPTTLAPPQPTVNLTDPPSNTWGFGQSKTVSWSATNGGCEPYIVEASTNGGSSWIVIGNQISGTSMNWTVGKDQNDNPIQNMLNNSNLRLKVYCANNTSVNDQSNSFSLISPSLNVTTPSALTTGQSYNISWSLSNAVCTQYTIELSTNGGGTPWNVLKQYQSSSPFTWTVPNNENGTSITTAIGSNTNQFKVYCSGYSTINNTSTNFSINNPTCSLTLPSANSGTTPIIGNTSFTASWPVVSGATDYEINVANSSNTTYSAPLAFNGTTTTNSINVTGLTHSTQYRYQIRAKCSNGVWTSWSPTLATPTTTGPLTLSNVSGVTWHCNKTINWSSLPNVGNVTIELGNTDTGIMGVIASNVPNNGSYTWVAGKQINNQGNIVDFENFEFNKTYYLKIYPHGTQGQDTNGNGFTIPQPSISVSSPVANTTFTVGQTITMNYATQNLCGPMTVELTNASGTSLQVMPNGSNINNISPYTYSITNTFPVAGTYKLKIYPTVSGGAAPAVGFTEVFTVGDPNCPNCIAGRTVADFIQTGQEGFCAAQYLCSKGIIQANQTATSSSPTAILKRQDAANLLVKGVLTDAQIPGYNANPANVAFPTRINVTPFDDLNNSSDPNNYHQAAKVLIYLSYADDENSITPFRKVGTNFYPNNGIVRVDYLKLICETFNISFDASSQALPYTDISGITGRPLQYLKRAYQLQLISNQTNFRPNDLITREEAFLILARLRKNHPQYILGKATLENSSNYLFEQNVTNETTSVMRSMASGNFAYSENGFAIPDKGLPLSFGFTYSSVITGWPDAYRKVEPLGVGWTHNFNSYILPTDKSVSGDNEVEEGKALLLLANGDGTFHTYDNTNNASPIVRSIDNFNEMVVTKANNVVSKYEIKRTDQVVFTYEKVNANEILYRLTKINDRYNNALTLTYKNATNAANSDLKVVLDKVTAQSGRYITFNYDSYDKLTSVVYPGESSGAYDRQLRFAYYAAWDETRSERLEKFWTARHTGLTNATRYKYGINQAATNGSPAKKQIYMLQEIIRPKNNRIKVDYDEENRVKQVEDGKESSTSKISKTTFNRAGCPAGIKCAKIVGNDGIEFTQLINDKEIIYEISSNVFTMKRPEYDASPRNPSWFSVNGLKHGYSYNGKGQMLTDTTYDKNGAVKHIQKWQYDTAGNMWKYWEPASNGQGDPLIVNNYSPDLRFLESTAQVANNQTTLTTTFKQAADGLLEYVINPEGLRTNFFYNAYGSADHVEYVPLNLHSYATYDFSSRLKTSTNAKNQTSQVFYDKNDNVVKTITPAPTNYQTIYRYDANDNPIEIENAKGKITTLTYDQFDRDSTITFGNSTQKYFYNNDAISVNFGKMTVIRKPWANKATGANLGRAFQFVYDSEGFLESNGYIQNITYKKSVAGVNPPDENTMLSIRGGNNANHLLSGFMYDDMVRMSEYTDHYQNKVKYSYYSDGKIFRITYPNNNYVDYFYDRAGRLTIVKWNTTTTLATYVYVGSRLDYVQYGNGVRTKYKFDNAGRFEGISTKKNNGTGDVIAEYTFGFDNIGNHTSENITEPFGTPPTPPATTTTYGIDVENNLLTSINGAPVGYDGDGNMITKGNKMYLYDKEDNLTEIRENGVTIATFEYDALGNRRMAIRNGVETRYVLDLVGMADVLAETDANNNVTNYYIHGMGLIARVKPDGTIHYYHGDFRGSVVAMTNASQVVTHKYQYDTDGNVTNSQEADFNPFRYVGLAGIMYETADLTYMRARYYDPTIGRFNSTDPIWSANLYPYANGNPVMNIDANGENPLLLSAAAGFAIGGVVGWTTYLVEIAITKEEFDIKKFGAYGFNSAVEGGLIGSGIGLLKIAGDLYGAGADAYLNYSETKDLAGSAIVGTVSLGFNIINVSLPEPIENSFSDATIKILKRNNPGRFLTRSDGLPKLSSSVGKIYESKYLPIEKAVKNNTESLMNKSYTTPTLNILGNSFGLNSNYSITPNYSQYQCKIR
jgi:RHS repeat-associated protein